MTIRESNVSFHRRARYRSCYFQIRIRPRRQRIVARDQNALATQVEIHVRLRQFGENNPATKAEWPTRQIAAESFQAQSVAPKEQARLKPAQSRQSRVGKSRGIDRDIAAATEFRTGNGPADRNIKRHIAVELLDRRNELAHEVHRASRQSHRRLKRRVFVKRTRAQDFSGIEWHSRGNTDGLNPRLLQFPRNIDFVSRGISGEAERRRIKVRQFGVAQIPSIDIDVRLQLCKGTARLQFD